MVHIFWSCRLSELALLLAAVGLGTHGRLKRECVRLKGLRARVIAAARVQDNVEKVFVQ